MLLQEIIMLVIITDGLLVCDGKVISQLTIKSTE